MDTLPKLLYLFQTIPVIIPKFFFSTLRSLSIHFLWNKGLSRIKFKLLIRPKLQGSTGLPDFELYYKATLMARILEWFPRPFQKASVMAEQHISPVDLRALLWGYRSNLPALANSSPLTTAALVLWYRRGQCEILSSDPSTLSPLFDNPAFPQGIGAHALGSFLHTSWQQAHSFVHADNGTPNIPTGSQDWLTSLHLTTFTKHLFGSSQIYRPLTEFEHLSSL